jgi:hypothetical protein
MENQYQWKIKSLAKNVDVDKAVNEFKEIQDKYGALTPENIVNAARSKKSPLHPAFEWDNNIAAEHYRLQQARNIINNVEIIIISDGEERNIPVYEIIKIKDEERQYKHIETLTFNEVEQVKQNTIIALNQLTLKLKIYKEFDKIQECLKEAIELLQN